MTPQKQPQPPATAHKQKQVPQHLRSKLNKMIANLKSNNKFSSYSNGKVQWIDTNTLKIIEDPIIIAYIGTQFDMSLKTFIKFLEMIGCKVKRVEGEKMLGGGTGVYFIRFPVDNVQNTESNVLKQLMQPEPQQRAKTQHPNYYQLSIEAHLNRPQSQLFNIDYENELKDIFMKNFKNNANQTNEFIYNAVYKILVSKGKQQLSPCQIMEILTEIRDRIFENQKEVQECIQSFREKVRSFGESGGERRGEDKGDGKMGDQEEGRNGFQSVNFGSKNSL